MLIIDQQYVSFIPNGILDYVCRVMKVSDIFSFFVSRLELCSNEFNLKSISECSWRKTVKKSKVTRSVLVACMIISVIGVIILEYSGCNEIRKAVVKFVRFLSGKRVLLSNILLGIFSSSFCMYIGECVSIYMTRKTIRVEIIELCNELWPIIYVKPGKGREAYIKSASQFINYQSEIKRLVQEYDRKKDKIGWNIELLNQLLTLYKHIYEIETMKNNNYQFYIENLKGLNLDTEKIYIFSQYNDNVMYIRKFIESSINDFDEYKRNMDEGIDECIEKIVKIEKNLYDILKDMN